jgi:hypothetical protein
VVLPKRLRFRVVVVFGEVDRVVFGLVVALGFVLIGVLTLGEVALVLFEELLVPL